MLELGIGMGVEQESLRASPGRELDQFLASVERRAFRMARMATRIDAEAFDIVQDAMFSLVRSYRERPAEQWPALFMRILQNRILDWHRRQTRHQRRFWQRSSLDDDEDFDPVAQAADPVVRDPALLIERARDMDRVEAALQALPLRQQQVFMLRIWEGLDVAQCAQVMDCSEGSVKTHLFRALQNIRKHLGEDHE